MSFLATLKNLFGFRSKSAALEAGDRMLPCADCDVAFVFDAGEQRFFKEKGFTDPKRCPKCRKKVRSRMRKRGRGGHAEKAHRGGASFSRRHSVIDGDSPYADER
jgi:hypothetical protein